MTPPLPRMYVFTTANRRHGGFMSACALMDGLRGRFEVIGCPLLGSVAEENRLPLQSACDRLESLPEVPALGGNDHALLYLSDYATAFNNHEAHWRRVLAGAASVQIAFNRTIGGMHRQRWLADHTKMLYFLDSDMGRAWRTLTAGSPLCALPACVLAPPADLAPFREVHRDRPAPPPLIVGRLAGDGNVPRNAVDFYRGLADALPTAQFWFMPPPPDLESAFAGDPRFRFLARGAISPVEFFSSCHIYALTYWAGVPIPGPRSLMEAMAAGCAPVVVGREGPRDRVVHGESGFCTNDDREFADRVIALASDPALRARIGEGARRRSMDWDPQQWIDRIIAGSLGSGRAPEAQASTPASGR